MNEAFRRFATTVSIAFGTPWAFIIALLIVILWASTGKYFNYSDGWQLFINTGTTIVTFLMVFLIQATQNRDSKTINLKLDELLRAVHGARTGLVNLAALSDEDLLKLEEEFRKLGEREGIKHLRMARERDAGTGKNG
jgi:low affinity Fe/Cu permease